MLTTDVSWIGVILATVASVIIGGFWYAPKLFGSIWANAHNFDKDSLKPSPLNYGGAVLVAFVTTLILAMFIKYLPVTSIYDGAQVGFFAWLGFIATSQFSGVVWAKKPWLAYAIDVTCELVILVVAGAILAFFK